MTGAKKSDKQPDGQSDQPSADPVEENPADVKDSLPVDSSLADTLTVETLEMPAPARRGGLLVSLFGGLAAGCIGFLSAQYLGNDRWPFQSQSSAAEVLSLQVDSQEVQVETLQTELLRLESAMSAKANSETLDQLRARQGVSEVQLLEGGTAMEAIVQRLVDIENRPIPDVGATEQAVDVYSKELAAMRQMLESELRRIEAAQGQAAQAGLTAEKTVREGVVRAAFSNIQAAVQNGDPFGDPLNDLAGAGIEVPGKLLQLAADGVPSNATLRQEFPAAARFALAAAARDQADIGTASGVTAFLRNQLGIRSLEPRDGNDPDAILSRAEAAVKGGNIPDALFEIQSLPEAVAQEMQSWVEQAQRRLDALELISALSASTEG